MAIQYSDQVREAMGRAEKIVLEHATSLGLLCITWATIDKSLDPLVKLFLQTSKENTACLVANIEQVGARCEILKRLATVEAPSPEWREWFIAVLDRISGEIAPLRNRCIHDYWRLEGDMIRQDRRAKIVKSQSHRPEELQFNTEKAMPTEEVDRLRLRMDAIISALLSAELDLLTWRNTRQPVELDPQVVSMSKPNARYQTDQELVEAQQLGRPPFEIVFD